LRTILFIFVLRDLVEDYTVYICFKGLNAEDYTVYICFKGLNAEDYTVSFVFKDLMLNIKVGNHATDQ